MKLLPAITIISAFSFSCTVFAVGNDVAPARSGSVNAIVLHSIGGPECRDGEVVFTGSRGDAYRWKEYFEASEGISIHYIVDRDGNIASSIDENRVAWHARGMNSQSIGIELTNNGDGIEEYPRPMLESLRSLIMEIKSRHPDISNERIYLHSDVDDTTFLCGGRHEKRKRDPGPLFPYRELIEGL
jgi:N-acetyl-anhydromuramyl-L-alanine amidase AmpD